jgi:hypothetical protein
MTPQECCQAAEQNLARAGEFLLNPSPSALEECLQILGQVIETLETLAKGTTLGWDPAVHLAIHRIQTGARALGLRIEHGSYLIRGWMQLRLGEGYTRRGLPSFSEPQTERQMEV